MTYASGNELRDNIQQRATTRDWLREAATPISLVRSQAVSDGAGGYLAAQPTTLPSQLFVLQATTADPEDFNGAGGDVMRIKFVMTGRWDADVNELDKFTVGDNTWVIYRVYPDRSFETKATGEVVSNGNGLS